MRRIARKRGPDAAIFCGALLAAQSTAAVAQEYVPFRTNPPCVLDKCLNGGTSGGQASSPRDLAPSAPDEPAGTAAAPPFRNAIAPGSFDFYVLSLSWSPGFCETGGAAKARQQCEPGSGLGFVVHGLWPQNTHGYPSNCDSNAGAPSRAALDSVRGVYPDEGLARHEWRMHGTCTGLSPTDYFGEVRRARAAVVIPEPFRAPVDAQNMRPMEIARAFVAANPRLRTDSMAVTCRSGTLEEVRICFSKDLRSFVPCPELARASCRSPIEVPPVL